MLLYLVLFAYSSAFYFTLLFYFSASYLVPILVRSPFVTIKTTRGSHLKFGAQKFYMFPCFRASQPIFKSLRDDKVTSSLLLSFSCSYFWSLVFPLLYFFQTFAEADKKLGGIAHRSWLLNRSDSQCSQTGTTDRHDERLSQLSHHITGKQPSQYFSRPFNLFFILNPQYCTIRRALNDFSIKLQRKYIRLNSINAFQFCLWHYIKCIGKVHQYIATMTRWNVTLLTNWQTQSTSFNTQLYVPSARSNFICKYSFSTPSSFSIRARSLQRS